jgi:hypothetical protein
MNESLKYLRQEAGLIRQKCGYRKELAKAASQAEAKIVDSCDHELSPM